MISSSGLPSLSPTFYNPSSQFWLLWVGPEKTISKPIILNVREMLLQALFKYDLWYGWTWCLSKLKVKPHTSNNWHLYLL
jgi:hypothetical protein